MPGNPVIACPFENVSAMDRNESSGPFFVPPCLFRVLGAVLRCFGLFFVKIHCDR